MKKKLLLILILTFFAMIFVSCGADPDENHGIVTVNSSGDHLTCTFAPDKTLLDRYGRADLYLFALPAGDSGADLSGKNYVSKTRASDKVTYKINTVENGENRLYLGFTVAFFDGGSYIPAIDAPAFVSNPEILAKDKSNYPRAASMKGLVPDDATDAVSLGVSQALIKLPLEKYISTSGEISFGSGANKFYINKEEIEKLDEKVKILCGENINIYFEFTLTKSAEELGDLAFLAFPGTTAGAVAYLPDLRNDKCAAAVAGFADFIAERYTDVFAFVAGCGSNGYRKNANVGASESEFLRVYSAFARTLDTALRSHRKNGLVFVSIDNAYKVSSGGMSSSSFLEKLLKVAKSGGEYPFGVSLSLKATSTDPDRIWFDDSGSGNYITPSNIAKLMTSFLDTDAFLSDGEPRRVIVGDFSIAATKDTSTETNRAASYFYAYCKAALTGRVDAFIYSSHFDSGSGLYETDDSGVHSPLKIRDVLAKIDRGGADDDKIKKALGDGVYNSLLSAAKDKITVFESAGGVAAPSAVENYDAKTLTIGEIRTAGGSATVSDGKITLEFDFSADTTRPFAAFELPSSKIKSDTLILRDMTISQSAKVTLSVTGNGAVYESSIDLSANKPTTAVFDISEFSSKVKKGDVTVRLSLSGVETKPNEPTSVTMSLSEALTGKVRSNVGLVIALAALITIALAAIVFLTTYYLRKNR